MNSPPVPPFENQRASGQDILLPSISAGRKKRIDLIEINSRDRNQLSYPTSSQFRWRLMRPIKDIVSIQVVGGSIPTAFFSIDTGYNQFTFIEDGTTFTVTLTPGVYSSASDLATELQTRLNGISSIQNTYAVTVVSLTSQLKITGTKGGGVVGFSLLFATGAYLDSFENGVLQQIKSPRRLLGFQALDYTSSSGGIILSQNCVDQGFLTNRLYLYLNQENSQDLGTVDRGAGKKKAFSIVYFDSGDTVNKTFSKDTFEPTFVSSPAPISRLTTLDLSLRNEFDYLVNFNGRDFTLLLEIVHLE